MFSELSSMEREIPVGELKPNFVEMGPTVITITKIPNEGSDGIHGIGHKQSFWENTGP